MKYVLAPTFPVAGLVVLVLESRGVCVKWVCRGWASRFPVIFIYDIFMTYVDYNATSALYPVVAAFHSRMV